VLINHRLLAGGLLPPVTPPAGQSPCRMIFKQHYKNIVIPDSNV
jgi:hypothetical protein